MTRYFFDHRDNDHFVQDDVGLEFADLSAVQREAARALAEFASLVIPSLVRRVLTIEVRDDNGPNFQTRIVFEVIKMRGEPDQYGRQQSEARH